MPNGSKLSTVMHKTLDQRRLKRNRFISLGVLYNIDYEHDKG